MSMVKYEVMHFEGLGVKSLQAVKYEDLKVMLEAQPFSPGAVVSMSVQFSGTFGASGSVKFEGSNDGENYVTLTDPQGNQILKSRPSIEDVQEVTRFVRPAVVGGDESTNINCTVFIQRRL